MKKRLTLLLVLVLSLACIGFFAAWRNASRSAAKWETQYSHLLEDLDERLLIENPISNFFSLIPYSGATARYLSTLEADAWQAELLHAAGLLKDAGTDDAFLDAFLEFIEQQADAASGEWAENLEAQGAVTAGAWAHLEEARIAPYRFGALSLISACQREGIACAFQFSPEETRQHLLDVGFQEDFLDAAGFPD